VRRVSDFLKCLALRGWEALFLGFAVQGGDSQDKIALSVFLEHSRVDNECATSAEAATLNLLPKIASSSGAHEMSTGDDVREISSFWIRARLEK